MTLLGSTALANPATFTIDPTATTVTISGTLAGLPITQQGPGSLTTTYFGAIRAELAPGAVRFVQGGNAVANNSGSWQPAPGGAAGSAPANYGGQVNFGLLGIGRLAIRNLQVDAFSDPIPLASGSFAASQANVIANTGTADFRSTLLTGSEDLAGSSGPNSDAGPGSLAIAANPAAGTGTATLTLPIRATLITDVQGIGQAVIQFNGQFRGRVSSIGGDANFDTIVDLAD
ncbi:MAG: hypothetical protein RMJ35_11785, partial [Phycisphaerales bacterium]|nr:hypothetical protein [Phycisphaerales bacterium]